jgi:peptide/nickel transport system substrate-binding protein
VYWRDTIDIPVIQWLHRIPYNQTYWVGYPTRENVAGGINGAYWAHTFPVIAQYLKPAQ